MGKKQSGLYQRLYGGALPEAAQPKPKERIHIEMSVDEKLILMRLAEVDDRSEAAVVRTLLREEAQRRGWQEFARQA